MTLLNIKLKNGSYMYFRGTYIYALTNEKVVVKSQGEEFSMKLADIDVMSEQIPNQKSHINRPIWGQEHNIPYGKGV